MRRLAAVCLVLVLVGSSRAQSQEPAEPGPELNPWVMGISAGVPRESGNSYAEYFMVGAHTTHVRPGRVGADVSLSTLPRLVPLGVFPFVIRAGVVLTLPLGSNLLLLPGAGISAVGGISSEGGGAGGGLQAGAALIAAPEGRPRLRAGATWHQLAGLEGAIVVLELGVLFSRDWRAQWNPRSRGPGLH
jgi:hypothetical protein